MAEGESALLLILLKIFLTQPFLPPNLPPNDRLRQADLSTFLSYVRLVIFSCGQKHHYWDMSLNDLYSSIFILWMFATLSIYSIFLNWNGNADVH